MRQKLQPTHVMWFLAVLGWVLLGIGCSVTLPLLWQLDRQNDDIREGRDCGCDNGDSLLIVTTG